MPDFTEMFEKNLGNPIIYKNRKLTLVDEFPVTNGEKLILSIESTNSKDIQGIAIEISGYCELNGEKIKRNKKVLMIFWEKSDFYDPRQIELIVYTKKDCIRVKNIWEVTDRIGNKSFASMHSGAAMIVEEIENGRRYRCNDWHPDENFDDIVFTITRAK